MNYGLYIAASGMQTSMARMNVFANNLANVESVGFKPDMVAVRQRDPVRAEDGLAHMDSNRLLERLGAGVMPTATRVDLSQGALRETERPLDVAIDGEGFLVVRAAGGPEGLRLTRDGRLGFAPDGRLVMAANGMPVLGEGDRPVWIDPARPMEIRGDGAVIQDGFIAGRLQIVDALDRSSLAKAGDGLLMSSSGEIRRAPAPGRLVQGSLEGSGVSAISTMMDVTGAASSASGSMRMISYVDELLNRAINGLGRVS